MADSSVSITPGAGANVDTRTTSGGDHRQVMAIGNDGDAVVGLEPWGALQVNNGFSTLFYDSWTAGPDTVDRWTVSNGTAPSLSGGNMTMPSTAGYHAIRTKDTVKPNSGFTYVANGITLEGATAGTGATRFWGLGTPATTPSATSMAQEGAGFEVDASGALHAVTYTGGVRTSVATLTRPTDGLPHRYAMYFRVTSVVWFIDNLQVAVASVSFPTIAVVELPALLARFNGTLANSPVFTNIAHLTGDTSRLGHTIMDPVVGTRQARVADPSVITGAMAGTATTSLATDRTVGAALNVNPNAIQKSTYKVTYFRTTGPAYAAGTIQWHLSLHHAATATKTVRIRRIIASHTIPPVATTGSAITFQLHWLTAAPTGTALAAGAGTATTAYKPLDGRNSAGEATALTIPTVTSAGILEASAGLGGVATHNAFTTTLYDWQESGETQPITLRAGVLEGIAIGAVSTAAVAATANINTISVEITFTEE